VSIDDVRVRVDLLLVLPPCIKGLGGNESASLADSQSKVHIHEAQADVQSLELEFAVPVVDEKS